MALADSLGGFSSPPGSRPRHAHEPELDSPLVPAVPHLRTAKHPARHRCESEQPSSFPFQSLCSPYLFPFVNPLFTVSSVQSKSELRINKVRAHKSALMELQTFCVALPV